MIPVGQEEFQALARRHGMPKRSKGSKALGKREAGILQMRKAGEPKRAIAMTACLSRGKLSWGWEIKPEARSCIQFADRMREHSIKGRYRGIWGHLPNEGKRSQIAACIMIAMGMLPGGTDFFFMGDWGHGVIEFKVPGEDLTLTQQCYRDWCEADGVRHAVAYSPDAAESILREWGAL
jgi:hypothetical protein